MARYQYRPMARKRRCHQLSLGCVRDADGEFEAGVTVGALVASGFPGGVESEAALALIAPDGVFGAFAPKGVSGARGGKSSRLGGLVK